MIAVSLVSNIFCVYHKPLQPSTITSLTSEGKNCRIQAPRERIVGSKPRVVEGSRETWLRWSNSSFEGWLQWLQGPDFKLVDSIISVIQHMDTKNIAMSIWHVPLIIYPSVINHGNGKYLKYRYDVPIFRCHLCGGNFHILPCLSAGIYLTTCNTINMTTTYRSYSNFMADGTL